MQPHSQNSTKRLVAIAALALLPSIATAVCTTFKASKTDQENGLKYEAGSLITVERTPCPEGTSAGCTVPAPKVYNVTARREIWRVDDLLGLHYHLPTEEQDAIFKLASDAYYNERDWYTEKDRELWVSISSQANSSELVEKRSRLLHVEPGKETQLQYKWFRSMAWGVLGGCTNASLENVQVQVTAPFMRSYIPDQLPGLWTSTTDKIGQKSETKRCDVGFQTFDQTGGQPGDECKPGGGDSSDKGKSTEQKDNPRKPSGAQGRATLPSLTGSLLALGLALVTAVF
ncbi:uncharacterized protein E0L32_007664 [Thyridium curvatum]|uniref:Uncharacterized protein n=1 Tax=Thyridium curvatum TaxID=1093900 RepID=A0A507AM05_9PEZI|nr:uncharacterized protein E0L32_007664 [Thyridium curvatum]TPX11685.1 hypothetical protein E0L32_007664 [Thyridium curvatum]